MCSAMARKRLPSNVTIRKPPNHRRERKGSADCALVRIVRDNGRGLKPGSTGWAWG